MGPRARTQYAVCSRPCFACAKSCSTQAPKPSPSTVHMIACAPSEAMRNCHSTTAGKPSGTSFSGRHRKGEDDHRDKIDGGADQRRIPRAELIDEAIPDIPGGDHGAERQQDHPEIDRGAQADRVGVADRRRVRRIFEDRDGVDGEEAAERDHRRGHARAPIPDPAVAELRKRARTGRRRRRCRR